MFRPLYPAIRSVARAVLAMGAVLGVMAGVPACSTEDPMRPVLRAITGPVVLRGYFVAADGRFNGTRVVGDADGVKVELLGAGRVLATTTTVNGTYRFSGLAAGTYRVRTVTVGAVHDTTEELTVAVADVAVADTLRLSSRGDLYPVPNPFADTTRILFEVPAATSARIAVRDLAGNEIRLLRTGALFPGLRGLVWDGLTDRGEPAAASMYWVVYESGADVRSQLLFRTAPIPANLAGSFR